MNIKKTMETKEVRPVKAAGRTLDRLPNWASLLLRWIGGEDQLEGAVLVYNPDRIHETLKTSLSDDERKVVAMRVGMNWEHPRTLAETAEFFDMEYERAMALEKSAQEKLKGRATYLFC